MQWSIDVKHLRRYGISPNVDKPKEILFFEPKMNEAIIATYMNKYDTGISLVKIKGGYLVGLLSI